MSACKFTYFGYFSTSIFVVSVLLLLNPSASAAKHLLKSHIDSHREAKRHRYEALVSAQVKGRNKHSRLSEYSPAKGFQNPPSPFPNNAITPPPDQVEWADDASDVPEKSLVQDWPKGVITATVLVAPVNNNSGAKPATVAAGAKNIRVIVQLTNKSSFPQRVLEDQPKMLAGDKDYSAWAFILPLSELPAVIPPHGQAQQTFRLDTFNDTPSLPYRLLAQVACVPVSADLLQNGNFEQPGKVSKSPTLGDVSTASTMGWSIPADASSNVDVAAVESSASYAILANSIADWSDFIKLITDNTNRIASQGSGLLEASHDAAGVVAEQTVNALVPGERYIAGVDAWGGGNVHLELLDQAGKSVGGQSRDFYSSYWRGRTISFRASKSTTGGRLSLFAFNKKSWWDNAFLVPTKQIRQAIETPAPMIVTAPKAAAAVAYMGEDRQTQGNWIGKYGQYAFILCGMSAPEDMVGGEVRPLKCDYADMQKVYSDETIRVSGKGTLRYAAWTGNPSDVQPRHWIDMPLRQGWDQVRALDNPQWGYRTSASWDDHGETYVVGPDLYIRLRMPPGIWRVSYYFLDWNYYNSINPRKYRLAFLDSKNKEICTGRVLPPQHGTGVYKVFRVQGGKDVVLRIRKDFTLNAIIAGVFVDRLSPERGPAPQIAGLTSARNRRLADATRRWQTAASSVDGYAEEVNALEQYRNILTTSIGREKAAQTLSALGDQWFSQGEYWRSAIAYDLSPQATNPTSLQKEQIDESRALQFRIVFPRYAVRKINEAITALNPLSRTENVTETRALATRLFDVAIKDHTDSNGLQRLPMLLAKAGYDALEGDLGYNNLTATERAKKLAIAERMTWYTSGWDDVASEAKRFWPTLTEKQRTALGAGFYADHVVHPYGILAQSDYSYLDKSVALVNAFVKENPRSDAGAFAQYELAKIYYQQGQNDQVRPLCNRVISEHPDSNPSVLCKALLMRVH